MTVLRARLGVSHQAQATPSIQKGHPPLPQQAYPLQVLTQEPLIALCLSFQECVDTLDSPQLDLHVCQVPHHPVEVVGDLRGEGASQSQLLSCARFPLRFQVGSPNSGMD